MAALGAEMASGDFEVFEYCFAGMPDQPALNPTTPEGEWVALASGMEMGTASDVADVRAELLSEWLLGEAGDDEVASRERSQFQNEELTVFCIGRTSKKRSR